MSGFCDLMVAAGLTLGGLCQPPTPAAEPLPHDDAAAWAAKAPTPVAAPAPAAAPNFPTVVVVKTIREGAPAPAPASAAPGPDPLEQAMLASYESRTKAPATWPGLDGPATAGTGAVEAPPMPPGAAGAADSRRGEAKYREKGITSSLPVDNSRIVTTDRYITGVLETGINTQLDGSTGGPVIIQTSRDVFGYHGREILIPKGSRLVCSFKSLAKQGASRAPLKCSRILLAESRAEIFGLKANVTDMQGGLGVSGDVDNRFWEKYGTAFILAGVSAAVMAASSGSSTSSTSATATGSTSSYTGSSDIVGNSSTQLAQQLGKITASTLQQTINLTPILRIAQGTLVQIRPDTDWYIANAE